MPQGIAGLATPRATKVTMVFSGDLRLMPKVVEALAKLPGLKLVVIANRRAATWGLPAYTDPVTAERAGHPNSGHTPGTTHPPKLRQAVDGNWADVEHRCGHVGEDYEDDLRVGFLTFTGEALPAKLGEFVDGATAVATAQHWQLRMHFLGEPPQ